METVEAKSVAKLTNQLLRGTSQNDWATVYSAYSQLHQMGSPVIGDLKSILLNSDWPAPRYGFEVKWLSILVSLVYDLDLDEGNAVVAKFSKGGSHFALKTIANTIKSEQNWPYRKYQIKQINIFEDATLKYSYNIKSHLSKWLDSIPDDHLKDLKRLNVIARPFRADYLGNYYPLWGIINLVWHYSTPFHAIERIEFRHTLYHEIGHHHYGHSGGQDPDQEKLANRYADQAIRRSRPAWNRAVRSAIRSVRTRLMPRRQ